MRDRVQRAESSAESKEEYGVQSAEYRVLNGEYHATLDPILDPTLDPFIDSIIDPILDPTLDSIIDSAIDPTLDSALRTLYSALRTPSFAPSLPLIQKEFLGVGFFCLGEIDRHTQGGQVMRGRRRLGPGRDLGQQALG